MPAEIGLKVSNETRINKTDYPWYLRIVPMSILWVHFINNSQVEPLYQRDSAVLAAYINKELGASCDVKPQNASLKLSGETLKVVPSHDGGTCDVSVVTKMLSDVKPILNNDVRVTIPVKVITPVINNEAARQQGESLQKKAGAGVVIMVNDTPQTIPMSQLFSWIDFSVAEEKLTYVFNEARASAYLNKEVAPKLAVNSGITTVDTHDFIEVSCVVGANGKKLDVGKTLTNIKSFIDGDAEQAVATTAVVSPRIVFSRSYSPNDVGLSALMQQYSQDHAGVYGVSLIELSGQNRRASFNNTKLFTTASTYKLFVAYSTLKRVEEGSWRWTDSIVDVRNLSTCFDDMIVKSDNACAGALLKKVGYKAITDEAKAQGFVDTSFLGSNGIKTTPADLALFLAKLQTGQMLTQQASRDTLINAMKRNVYRSGIPAGVNGVVADKVGFLDGLLHDASIVYAPTGTYVLVIMTDGLSWKTIADLASKVEALRAQ